MDGEGDPHTGQNSNLIDFAKAKARLNERKAADTPVPQEAATPDALPDTSAAEGMLRSYFARGDNSYLDAGMRALANAVGPEEAARIRKRIENEHFDSAKLGSSDLETK